MIKNISNLGDAALYCDFGKEVNGEINSYVISYFNYLKKMVEDKSIQGITNLSPSYNKLIVSFDLSITNFQEIKNKIETIKILNNKKKQSKKIQVPVCCEEKNELDLLNLSKNMLAKNMLHYAKHTLNYAKLCSITLNYATMLDLLRQIQKKPESK